MGAKGQNCADNNTASAAVRKQRRRAQYRDVVARCEGGAVKRARKGAGTVVKPDRPNHSQAKTAESPVWTCGLCQALSVQLPASAIRKPDRH